MDDHRESFDAKNIRDIVDLYLENEVNNFQNNENVTGIFLCNIKTILLLLISFLEKNETTTFVIYCTLSEKIAHSTVYLHLSDR